MADSGALLGGGDFGAEREGNTVVRTAGPWTPSVHRLLEHLESKGFAGSPRPITIEGSGERLTYLPGEVVGDQRPWPSFVHTDGALVEVARWLRRYHEAVADFVPPWNAIWREQREPWRPGLIIAHNDAAPYNCVWTERRVVGFVDWDMAGPRSIEDDIAWVAFSWIPLHARSVVRAEGFEDFDRRENRLQLFLEAYGWEGPASGVLSAVDRDVVRQIDIMNSRAAAGDPTYERMLRMRRHLDLEDARTEIQRIRQATTLAP